MLWKKLILNSFGQISRQIRRRRRKTHPTTSTHTGNEPRTPSLVPFLVNVSPSHHFAPIDSNLYYYKLLCVGESVAYCVCAVQSGKVERKIVNNVSSSRVERLSVGR